VPRSTTNTPIVGFFVSCLVDSMRPSVARAAIDLLRQAGCRVRIPPQQTCCGQIQWNGGAAGAAAQLAQQVIEMFRGVDYVVVPSGSCAGMLRHHYPLLLEDDWRAEAEQLAARTWELTSFLYDVMAWTPKTASPEQHTKTVYHDACAGLRELNIQAQPRALLAARGCCSLQELQRPEVCCGFGGAFCVKMPQISASMADRKLDDAMTSGAEQLVAGDLGCLLALAGRSQRRGLPLKFRHVVELLTDRPLGPAIGEAE
jgi:L-lactate dehydrogenase complex protein LldE